ncbi:histidine phosphatase family protein [Paraglaciecola chathamensis]|uniref:Histidine phosphatase family protein n=1 Tax=Paraglaciecola chathamensis TaxID=368405 RepID=A0ABS0WA92_9ALTE|nr:histidine phosphatase family protein [Paraglaciecola chathamensis]MBJ2135037.1 histidine phosphatase family protein [Paraglaciecola chathamensis]
MSSYSNSSTIIRFYLCRHGQSEFNALGLLQGHLESPLSPLGITQAESLALKAKQWGVEHIVSSHLGRAQQTAHICAEFLNKAVHHLQLITPQSTADLAERHLGAWQGKAVAQLAEFHQFNTLCYQQTHLTPPNSLEPDEQRERINSPEPDNSPEQVNSLERINSQEKSESTDTVRQRMQNALRDIAQMTELHTRSSSSELNVLVISHGDALACLMSQFTQPVLLKNTQGMLLTYQNGTLEWGGLID